MNNCRFLVLLIMLASLGLQGQKQETLTVNGKAIKHTPRTKILYKSSNNCIRTANRTFDGTCNNISSTAASEYGATDIQLTRNHGTNYGDGNRTMAGQTWANPRSISNIVVNQTSSIPSPDNLSSLVFTWGQFLDHDITLSPENAADNADIPLPNNEPTFTSPIHFSRSEVYPGSSPRDQINIITAWIDASNVYGSDQTRANWLRTFQDGKLKTSMGDLLPYNTTNAEATGSIDSNAPSMAGDNGGTTVTYVAGDIRAAEQPGLTSLHTLFVREHNRLCDEMLTQGMTNDETIYQAARKMVGALVQKITFEDFLPSLGLDVGGYTGYDPSANPNIISEFSTAAYRIGHTMVTENMELRDNDGNLINTLPLLQAFFNPSIVANNGIEPILMGLGAQVQEDVDPFIVSSLRDFLFPTAGSPVAFGLDLASLNIQRGRDHGLVDFMTIKSRSSCEPIDSFEKINSDPNISSKLREAYNNDINSIDLWIGLLAEEKLSSSSFGPTMHSILYKQFKALRDGDYYYYKNDPTINANQLSEIRNTNLRDIIIRNTSISNFGQAFYAN